MLNNNAKSLAGSAIMFCAVAVSACGTNTGDRAVSGGLIGAAGGAAIGAVAGNAGLGAVIGGVGGTVVGAATNPCSFNLGDPFWRTRGGASAYHARCG